MTNIYDQFDPAPAAQAPPNVYDQFDPQPAQTQAQPPNIYDQFDKAPAPAQEAPRPGAPGTVPQASAEQAPSPPPSASETATLADRLHASFASTLPAQAPAQETAPETPAPMPTPAEATAAALTAPGFAPGPPQSFVDPLSGAVLEPQAPPGEQYSFTKGLVGGTLGANPKDIGSAMDAFGVLSDNPSIREQGKSIAAMGQAQLEAYKPAVGRLSEVGSLEQFGSWAGYQLGSTAATSLPSIFAGTVTSLLTANPAVGLVAGAAVPSIVQNWGDIYSSAQEDKAIQKEVQAGTLSEKDVAAISLLAAIPSGLLDAWGLEKTLGAGLFAEAKHSLVKRLALWAAGGGWEGGTEGAQQVIQEWALHYLGTDSPLGEKAMNVVEATLGGVLGGLGLGAAGHAVSATAKILTTPEATANLSLDEIMQAYREAVPESAFEPETTSFAVTNPRQEPGASWTVSIVRNPTEGITAIGFEDGSEMAVPEEVRRMEPEAAIRHLFAGTDTAIVREEAPPPITSKPPEFQAPAEMQQGKHTFVNSDGTTETIYQPTEEMPPELTLGRNKVDLRPAARVGFGLIQDLARRMGFDPAMYTLVFTDDKSNSGYVQPLLDALTWKTEGYRIALHLPNQFDAQGVWVTLAHEFGHSIVGQTFSQNLGNESRRLAPMALQQAYAPFAQKYMALALEKNMKGTGAGLLLMRDNFVQAQRVLALYEKAKQLPRELHTFSEKNLLYHLGFSEWFAEQAARWITTNEQPKGIVDKYFAALGRDITKTFQAFDAKFPGLDMSAAPNVKEFLNGLVKDPLILPLSYEQYLAETRRQNEADMRAAGVKDFPATTSTLAAEAGRGMFSRLFGGKPPAEIRSAAVASSHWQKWWKWGIDLISLRDANPHLEPLARYTRLVELMNQFVGRLEVAAEKTQKLAMRLKRSQVEPMSRFIDDYNNMRYRTAEERRKGVERMPTPDEFEAMIRKHGIDAQGLAVFQTMRNDFNGFVDQVMQVLRDESQKLPSAEAQAAELERIAAMTAALKKKPYFPATRYGKFTLTMRTEGGHVIAFERFETQREQKRRMRYWQKNLEATETVQPGMLTESTLPFAGLPAPLLDLIIAKAESGGFTLSKEQIDGLKQLRYEVAPIQSFSHHFQHRNLTPGYSMDWRRNYSNYFFHGARFLGRMKYHGALEEAANNMDAQAKATSPKLRPTQVGQFLREHFGKTAVPEQQIADFMKAHFKMMQDGRADWSIPRAFAFQWMIAWKVATATMNLTQNITSTGPHLGANFGDFQAARAMTKAALDWRNFYTKNSIERMTEPDKRALAELIRIGKIDGLQAQALASLSENRNLLRSYGSDTAQQALTAFMKGGAYMFQLTEQTNRRVAGMATFDLAMKDPTNKFVTDSVKNNLEFFNDLRGRGFPTQEAAAIVAAAEMINRTQFQYEKEFRPRYMRGPLGSTVFVFKLFQHRMLWNMYNHPGVFWRSMIPFMLLGGLMGVPGADDLKGLAKAFAWQVFGKRWDAEEWLRSVAVDWLGMDPVLMTRGLAAYGYGLPIMLDMIGEWSGLGNVPFPVLDRSKAFALGNVLPVDLGVLFGPGAAQDVPRAVAESLVKAAGANGGAAYNLYKAMENVKTSPTDFDRWSRAAPQWLAGMGKAVQLFMRGEERNAKGEVTLRYDPRDPEQMAEILATALGYTTARRSEKIAATIAQADNVAFWDLRKSMILAQYAAARRDGDPEEIRAMQAAVRKFNDEIKNTPQRGWAITGDTLMKSIGGREKARAMHERGLATQLKKIPLVRDIQRLFPGAEIDVRKVK